MKINNKENYYLDFVFPKGHKKFNVNNIDMLSDTFNLNIVDLNDYYKNGNFSNVKKIDMSLNIKEGKLLERFSLFKLIRKQLKIIKNKDFDFSVVGSFEVVSLFLASLFRKKNKKIFLIHHNDLDQILNSKIKKYMYLSFYKKYSHILLEDYIQKKHMEIFPKVKNSTFLLNHIAHEGLINNLKCELDATALSNSNDEDFIKHLIENEEKYHLFEKNELKVIIKSKQYTFNSPFLNIISGFLEKETFDEYISQSSNILVLYPATYKYRTSGILSEGLAAKKRIISTDILLVRSYQEKYKDIIKICKNYEDLVNMLISNRNDRIGDFTQFLNEHSTKYINTQFCNIIKKVEHKNEIKK